MSLGQPNAISAPNIDTHVHVPPMTEYVVLGKTADGWAEFSRANGRDSAAAIKTALGDNTAGGTFIAVPARSWRPVKVTPKTETTLVLEEVKP